VASWSERFVSRGRQGSNPVEDQTAAYQNLAFYVESREAVDAAHRVALDMGMTIHFPPEEDKDIPGFYEMFVFDPDGLRIEVAYGPPELDPLRPSASGP
jgi:catechol 2,3-dioxygenase-like lactoylglutathione lyase family enzyme